MVDENASGKKKTHSRRRWVKKTKKMFSIESQRRKSNEENPVLKPPSLPDYHSAAANGRMWKPMYPPARTSRLPEDENTPNNGLLTYFTPRGRGLKKEAP